MRPNLACLLTEVCVAEPSRLALSEAATGRSLTWLQLDELVERVVQGLFDAGLVAGSRVMVVSRNRIEAVAAYLGTLRAGMVAVPVDPEITTGELVRTIIDSGARLLVADETAVTTVRGAVRGVTEAMAATDDGQAVPPRVVTIGTTVQPGERGWDQLVLRTGTPVPVRSDPEGLAALLYTSGASGRPRAAMLSHRALLANLAQLAAMPAPLIGARDVVLAAVPLHHVYGLNAVLGQALLQHARLVLLDRFDAEGSLDLIEDEAVSVAPVTPGAIESWLDVPGLGERVGSLRLVVSGSAALSAETAAEFERRTALRVHQGYGLTECAPVVTSTLADPEGYQGGEGSVGRPLPGVDLRLRDELGRSPEEGDPAQIQVRGPQLFSGYWPHGRGGPGDDGWWSTGDVGFLDAGGDLHLVDRARDVVVVSGFTVFPVEVEEVVAELAEVDAVAAVGVDDEDTGEAVVCFVAPSATGGRVDPADLRGLVLRHCASRLARFKVPVVVEVLEELPRTPTGKIQKGRLRAAARGRDAGLLS